MIPGCTLLNAAAESGCCQNHQNSFPSSSYVLHAKTVINLNIYMCERHFLCHHHPHPMNDHKWATNSGLRMDVLCSNVCCYSAHCIFLLIAPVSALVIYVLLVCILYITHESNCSSVIRLPSFHNNHQMTSNNSCFFPQSSNISAPQSDMVTSAMSRPFPAI